MTPGCPGCLAAHRGAAARDHTEECRKRMEGKMEGRGDERVERMNQRLANEMEKEL